jgi:prefoldin subunit 5
MAKKRAQTRLDSFAVAAGAALGRLAARIDNLTKRREAISAEIQRYVRQAEDVVRGLTANGSPRRARKAAKTAKKAKKATGRRRAKAKSAR